MQLTCRDSDIGRVIVSPDIAAAIFLPMMLKDRETLVVMYLDARRRVMGACVAAVGTVDQVHFDAHALYHAGLVLGARHMLVAHNHPSGDPTPSAMDLQTTRTLEELSKLTGIGFVDHLVMTHTGQYRSIAEYMETNLCF
jgi:DNA repair protein RadC